MAQPQTLRQLAGVESALPPVADSVLVPIDCQREYVDGWLPLHGVDAALADRFATILDGRRDLSG